MADRTLGVILAGGRSSRFGADKALALLGGRPMASHVAERLAPHVDAVALNANGGAVYEALHLAVFGDGTDAREGPLAGIIASLAYARENGFDSLVTVPCDAPALCIDLVVRLRAARDAACVDCALAIVDGQINPVFALYRTDLHSTMAMLFRAGLRAPRELSKYLKTAFAPFDSTEAWKFADIDTVAELEAFAGGT